MTAEPLGSALTLVLKTIASSLEFVPHVYRSMLARYKKLHLYGKLFIWLAVVCYVLISAFIITVTPSRIAQFMYDQASKLAALRFGWLVLAASMVVISFPPLIGHTTLVTLCGFAYGMKGFFIAVGGSLIGATLVFVCLRYLFEERLRWWSSRNVKWQALEAVVKAKGLPLIILIRVSPFPPWVYSNSLFASIEAVKLWQFVVATCFIAPKLLLHVFIGSRIANLSDGDQRGQMDTRTKVLNWLLVGAGMVIAIFASWLVYSLVQDHIRHLEGIVDELAVEALEEYDEDAPLLSSDPRSPDTY